MPALILNDRGAALVEILVVIALSSLLIGLFLHADLAVNRSIMRWIFRSGLEQAAISLSKQLRKDSNDCDSLHLNNGGDVEVFRSGISMAVYSFDGNTITRNGRTLLPEKITMSDFSLDPLSSTMNTLPIAAMSEDLPQQVLTVTLNHSDQAIQTMQIAIRPYLTRQID